MEITGGRSFDGEIGDVQIFTGGKQAGRVMIYVLEKGSPTKKTWYWLYLRQLREACVKHSNQLREANEGEGRREGSEEREGKAKGDGQEMEGMQDEDSRTEGYDTEGWNERGRERKLGSHRDISLQFPSKESITITVTVTQCLSMSVSDHGASYR